MEKLFAVGITAFFAALLLTLPFVTALCACSRPGAPGKLTGFDCSRTGGTTDNVSFYIPVAENNPKEGQLVAIWARKTIGDEVVPVNNLKVTVSLDSQELVELTTNEDGYCKFTADEAGTYTVEGGDAKFEFAIAKINDPDPPDIPPVVPETEPVAAEGVPQPDPAPGGDNQQFINEDFENEPAKSASAAGSSNGDFMLYACLAAAVVIISAIMLKHNKNEKRRKSKEKKGNPNLKKYNIVILSALAVLVIGFIWFSSSAPCCSGSTTPPVAETQNPGNSTGSVPVTQEIKVELYHFHATQQCYSCVRLGELAEKTVKTYFTNETASGKLVFGHINYDLAANAELSDKFGVSGSSLWIGTTIDGKFTKEENIKVWYKLNDEKGYMTYLKGLLEKRLAGDLSAA